jgi:hypothetical protein
MKQGKATFDVDTPRKREPIVHVYNPGGVAQQGIMVIQNPTPLGPERGFMAPSPESETVHDGGTQGKHK